MKISIKTADWQLDHAVLSAIRNAVFVQEQQVPVELEMDEHDADAQHWLAFDGDQAIATVRMLKDGHIGRMAVLKYYRGNGIGNNILQHLIETVKQQSLFEVYLHSQTHAIGFYQKLGFSAYGDEFMDAGIPHRNMKLQLAERRLLGQHGGNFAIKDYPQACLNLVSQTSKQLRILSFDLDRRCFETPEMISAISTLARRSRYSDIRIMVVDTKPLVSSFHRLVNLQRRLSSIISIRRTTTLAHNIKNNLLLADHCGIISQSLQDPDKRWANFNNRPVVENHCSQFDDMWALAVVDNDLRQLEL
ncbi:MAG: putative GNAT family N-acyltransferase [Oceanicoccus sp.]|jgi:predicted GNAT family N-acyltransferase